MAYRSSATTTQAAPSLTIAATMPAGIAVGDYLACVVTQDASGNVFTPPAGWTSRGSNGQAGPGGKSNEYFDRICTGTEGATQTWTSNNNTVSMAIVVALTGRNVAPRTFIAPTSNVVSNASPITLASTGGTSVAGDDLLYFVALDRVGITADYVLTPPAGFTIRENSPGLTWVTLHLATKNAQGAGATGSIAGFETGTANAGYGTYVASIAAAPVTNTVTGRLGLGMGIGI